MVSAARRLMKAVHFGAGNIGRGFVGLLLHEGGYELVFSDVAAPLVDAINAVSEYTVHEVGEGGTRHGRHRLPRDQQRRRTPTSVIDEIAGAERRHDRRRSDDPPVRRPAHRGGPGPARPVLSRRCRSWRARTRSTRPTCCATRSSRSRATRGMRWPGARCSRTPPSTASCPAQPRGRRRRRHGRAVLRVGDRASAVRRRPAEHPRRPLRRRPRAVHRAQALHGEHRARRHGVLRRASPGSRRSRAPCPTTAIAAQCRRGARGDLGAPGRQARPRSRRAGRRTARRSCGASAIPRCPTRCGGSDASRCASSAVTSASSAPRPRPPNAVCRSTPSSRRWVRRSLSTTRRTPSRSTSSGSCASRMRHPSRPP